jgi:hypothetical protein
MVGKLGDLVDTHIRDNVLRNGPLHQNQFTYQARKLMETALHSFVMQSENTIKHKEIGPMCFPSHRGALDRTSF